MSLMRIDDLFHFEKGTLQSSKCTEGIFDFITASSEWKTHNEYTHDCEALIFAAAASGSLGRTHYINGKFIASDLCFIITAKDPKKFPIDLKFYHMIFNEFKNDIVNSTKAGTSKEAIGMKAFGNYKLPYFDIDKQIKTKLQFVNMQHFKIDLYSELTHQLDLIKQLRQAFLREAMQGKLVKSTNTRETGHQLLAQIKAEKTKLVAEKKLKKEKELPLIKKDEIPFEIPEHWAWCRLGEIIYDTDSGKSPNCKNESTTDNQWGVIKTTAVQEMNFLENENKILPENFTVNEQHIIHEGDILITRAGPKNRVGIVCSVENITKNLILSDKTIRIKFSKKLLSPKYFTIALNSPLIKKIIEGKMTGMADSQVNITQDNIKNFSIPLPPFQEQEQIVSKLEELIVFCDGLDKSIKESQEYSDMLLQQVLREALQPKENIKTISIESRKIENPLKTILAGHIINLNNTTDFGRVKFQKLLFLTEYICKIDFDSNYIKKVAGPYDDSLIKSLEADFNRMRFFSVVQDKTDNKRVRYTALAGANELESLFLENFADESLRINNILLKFRPLSWGECELIATLYAVWNNRIIKNEPITDELLYSDFMAWDKQKSKYNSVFHKWLFWMKDERIIPDGWGKYIDKT